jgi:hypothetical protein
MELREPRLKHLFSALRKLPTFIAGMSPMNQRIVRRFDCLANPGIRLIRKILIVRCEQVLLHRHVLGQKCFAEVWPRGGVDTARHHTIHLYVFLLVEHGSYRLDPLMHGSFRSTVLRECCARVDAHHTPRYNDLAARRPRVVAHIVRRKRGTKHDALKAGIGTAHIRLGRHIVDGSRAAVEVVLRTPVNMTSIGNEHVKSRPFLPHRLKGARLRREGPNIALYKYRRMSSSVQRRCSSFAVGYTTVEDSDAIPSTVKKLG